MARTKLAVALALVGAALSPNANALGLGAVDVQSSLNQPSGPVLFHGLLGLVSSATV